MHTLLPLHSKVGSEKQLVEIEPAPIPSAAAIHALGLASFIEAFHVSMPAVARRGRRTSFGCALAVAIGLGPAAFPARAGAVATPGATPKSEADAALERAYDAFDEGRYLEASAELKAAYELDPRPSLLYARAQALRLAGDCAGALPLLREFVERGRDASEAPEWFDETLPEAQGFIEQCEAIVASRPDPTPGSLAPVESPPPPSTKKPPPARRDVAAGVTLGGGSAAAVVGAVLLGVAGSLAHRDVAGLSEPAYVDRGQRVRQMNVAGIVMLAIGGAAIVVAAVRYGVLARRRGRVARVRGDAGGISVRF